MNLRKIIKNRKAMTPLMIIIIVVASVIASLFIIVIATIPFIPRNVSMMVQQSSIRGNTTDYESLVFRATCDFAEGRITLVEIYHINNITQQMERYGYSEVSFDFNKTTRRYVQVRYFTATGGADVQNGTHLLFFKDEGYTLRVYYENKKGVQQPYIEHDFIYKIPRLTLPF